MTARSKNEPTFTICDKCNQPTRSDLINPVDVPMFSRCRWITVTRWYCSICRRNMHRNGQEPERDETRTA